MTRVGSQRHRKKQCCYIVTSVYAFKPIPVSVRSKAMYVLRGSDQRARASMRVRAIGVCVSYVTATG